MLAFLYFDPMYFVFLAPGLLLGLIASFLTKSTFSKYSRVGTSRGYTGAQAAHEMLRREGISGVRVERVNGFLSDHYDPRDRTLRLSDAVFSSQSLSAIGVACHEAGHAIQHARGYAMLKLRTTLVPATQLCSSAWIWIFMIGMFITPRRLPEGVDVITTPGGIMMAIAIGMLSVGVLFALVTLPVEWDATARAKKAMVSQNLVTQQEAPHAGAVLNAAFLTYVASAVTAILTLLYFLLRSGLLGGRND